MWWRTPLPHGGRAPNASVALLGAGQDGNCAHLQASREARVKAYEATLPNESWLPSPQEQADTEQ